MACAARSEDDVVIVTEPHELLDVRLCLCMYLGIGGGTVADLEDGHACAAVVQELCLYLFEDILGKDGRTGVEVINAFVHGISPSLCMISVERPVHRLRGLSSP